MTVVYGNLQKEKKDVLPKGPKHKSGNTFAKIVDASADYWKHNGEWPLDTPRNRKGKEDIEAIFETISIKKPSENSPRAAFRAVDRPWRQAFFIGRDALGPRYFEPSERPKP